MKIGTLDLGKGKKSRGCSAFMISVLASQLSHPILPSQLPARRAEDTPAREKRQKAQLGLRKPLPDIAKGSADCSCPLPVTAGSVPVSAAGPAPGSTTHPVAALAQGVTQPAGINTFPSLLRAANTPLPSIAVFLLAGLHSNACSQQGWPRVSDYTQRTQGQEKHFALGRGTALGVQRRDTTHPCSCFNLFPFVCISHQLGHVHSSCKRPSLL